MKTLKFTLSLLLMGTLASPLMAQNEDAKPKTDDAAPVECGCTDVGYGWTITRDDCQWFIVPGNPDKEYCDGTCDYDHPQGWSWTNIRCPYAERDAKKVDQDRIEEENVGKTGNSNENAAPAFDNGNGITSHVISTAWPTPSMDGIVNFSFFLEGRSFHKFSYSIFNTMGQMVPGTSGSAVLPSGKVSMDFPVESLTNGVYFFNMAIDEKPFTRKIVINKR